MITLVLADPITHVVYGDKWAPALPLFYAFWCANVLVPTAAPVMGLLNALGSSRLVLSFAFLWFAGTWVLSVPLILTIGALGYGIANAALQITNFAFFRAAQRRAAFSIVKPAGFPWLLAAAAAAPIFALELVFPAHSLWLLAAYASLALIAYAVLCARYGADYVQQVTRLAGIRLPRRYRLRTRAARSM
jgi:O-antigen/teichoic acid export membrane protein